MLGGQLTPAAAKRKLRKLGAVILAATEIRAARELDTAGRAILADAMAVAAADLAAIGVTPDRESRPDASWSGVQDRLEAAAHVALDSAGQALTDALSDAERKRSDDEDELTSRRAVRAIAAGIAARGLIGYVDTAGRNWRLSTYARSAVFAAATRMHVDAQAGTYAAANVGLVVVVGPVDGACMRCEPWVGAILSTGDTANANAGVTGTVGDALTGGLFHPRCRHSLQPLSDF